MSDAQPPPTVGPIEYLINLAESITGSSLAAFAAAFSCLAFSFSAACSLLTKKVHRMRLDPSFCEVQPARALYRGGVNNGGCIYESEKVRSKPFHFVPLGRILRAATCNLQSASNACARPASWWPTCVLRAAIREL